MTVEEIKAEAGRWTWQLQLPVRRRSSSSSSSLLARQVVATAVIRTCQAQGRETGTDGDGIERAVLTEETGEALRVASCRLQLQRQRQRSTASASATRRPPPIRSSCSARRVDSKDEQISCTDYRLITRWEYI